MIIFGEATLRKLPSVDTLDDEEKRPRPFWMSILDHSRCLEGLFKRAPPRDQPGQ